MIQDAARFRVAVWWSGGILLLLWGVKAVEQAAGIDLAFLGIYPHRFSGLLGILTGPLVHGNVFHLLSNSIPLGILIFSLIFFYQPIALRVMALVYLITGLWVWIIAREAYHIGASGVVYGLLSFFLFSGFIRKDMGSLAISFIVLILYGTSFFTGLLPTEYHISFESHNFGALVGFGCAVFWREVPMAGQETPSNLEPKEEEEQGSEPGNTEGTPPTPDQVVYPFPTDKSTSEGK
jgi:membrane associated rhomboid family serine protease